MPPSVRCLRGAALEARPPRDEQDGAADAAGLPIEPVQTYVIRPEAAVATSSKASSAGQNPHYGLIV